MARGRGARDRGGGQQKNFFGGYCFNCGVQGHQKQNCPDLANTKKEGNLVYIDDEAFGAFDDEVIHPEPIFAFGAEIIITSADSRLDGSATCNLMRKPTDEVFHLVSEERNVRIAKSDVFLKSTHKGLLAKHVLDIDGKVRVLPPMPVLICPDLTSNLFSEASFEEIGGRIEKGWGEYVIRFKDPDFVIPFKKVNKGYFLSNVTESTAFVGEDNYPVPVVAGTKRKYGDMLLHLELAHTDDVEEAKKQSLVSWWTRTRRLSRRSATIAFAPSSRGKARRRSTAAVAWQGRSRPLVKMDQGTFRRLCAMRQATFQSCA